MKSIIAMSGILVARIALAQQRPPRFEMEIKTNKLTDSIYLLEGPAETLRCLFGTTVSCSSTTNSHQRVRL
jgi:hypothetical protein